MQNMHMLKLNKQIFNVNVYTFFGNFSKNIDSKTCKNFAQKKNTLLYPYEKLH